MAIQILQEGPSALAEYARVSIAFEVSQTLDVAVPAVDGEPFVMSVRALPVPLFKNYDANGDGPRTWGVRFDLSKWTFFAAYLDGARVGGAAVAMRAAEIELLEGRNDLALLWDIRVALSARRHGVGSALMEAVESWASSDGARQIKVETQNINIPACRFYYRLGFRLRLINPHAYPSIPHETQMLWYKQIDVRNAFDDPLPRRDDALWTERVYRVGLNTKAC